MKKYQAGGSNIQMLGNIKFDSNKARKGNAGQFIVKDEITGKDFGVVRKKDGTYDWYQDPALDKNPIKAASNFLTNYYDSPKAKERHEKSFPKVLIDEVDQALTSPNFKSANYSDYKIKDVAELDWKDKLRKDWIENGTSYNVIEDQILINTKEDSAGTVAHEISHLLNKGKREMSKRDQAIFQKLKSNPKGMHDASHDDTPTEYKADVDAVRFLLYRNGIYDANTEDFTKEHLEKAKEKLKGDFLFDRLLQNTKDENSVIDALNFFSSTQKNSMGQYGKEGGISKLGYKKNSPYKDRKFLDINFPLITTKDMAFPILAVSDQGDAKILQPNTGMHKFKGNKVREYKLQSGGVDPGANLLNFMDKRSQRQRVEDGNFPSDTTGYVGSNQYYLDMEAGKVPHVADMLFFGDIPRNPSGKSKSKDRFREKQEGGEMQTYLSGLSPEEQDAFLDQYEQVFQDGGQLQVPVSISNAELEKGETVLGLDGALKHVDGKRHSSGGTPVILENGEKVFSDYLVVPEELQKILGVKKKTTFAQASKKYDTKKEFKVLEDSKDPYARETAKFSLNNKLAMLETVFQGQESLKDQKQVGRKLQTSYQKGGKYQEGKYFNHSGISDRFETLPDGKLYDPVTKNFYKRESDGNYTKVYSAPVQESSYRGPEFPLVGNTPETKTGYQLGTKDKFPSMRTQPVTENWDNGYRGPQFPIAGPTQVSQPTQSVVEPVQPIAQPTTPVQKARTARKLSGNSIKPVTQPNAPVITPRTGFKPTYSEQMPTPAELAELGSDTFQEKMPYLPNPNGVDERTVTFNEPTSSDPKIEARQSWFARNKDKFGINSKLAGTILDIGVVLSDNLQIDNPILYDHQKQPLFNRFYDYDNKETQRVAQTQINGIMNSNLPESVKQARIAEVTAQSQSNQSQVDFNNAQRYDQKQSADLNKLQGYQDSNIDARINDIDNYRQRKARVEDLKARFKNNQKEAIVGSVKNYLGYADELRVANELSPYFETSAITGRTKYKPQSTSNLKSNVLDQFAQSDQTTQNLPNGASLVKQGNMVILVSADGSAKQIDIK